MRLGEMEFDPAAGLVEGPLGRVGLTPRESALLACLVEASDRAVPREELLERAWGWQHVRDIRTKTVDVHVGRLRTKLALAGVDPRTIQTVRSEGYRVRNPKDADRANAPIRES